MSLLVLELTSVCFSFCSCGQHWTALTSWRPATITWPSAWRRWRPIGAPCLPSSDGCPPAWAQPLSQWTLWLNSSTLMLRRPTSSQHASQWDQAAQQKCNASSVTQTHSITLLGKKRTFELHKSCCCGRFAFGLVIFVFGCLTGCIHQRGTYYHFPAVTHGPLVGSGADFREE